MNCHRLAFLIVSLFFTSNTFGMEKHLPGFVSSLGTIVPKFNDFHSVPTQNGSWEPIYDALNSAYQELLDQKDTNRTFVKETLPILGKGHLLIDETQKARLNYSPAYYALGIMALEDNDYHAAAKHFEWAIKLSRFRPQEQAAHYYSMHAFGQTLIKLQEYTAASIIYTTLFADLEKADRPHWEPIIKEEVAKLIDKIEFPWRKLPAMLVVGMKRERDIATHAFILPSLMSNGMKDLVFAQNKDNIVSAMALMRAFADKQLFPEAQAVMANIHLKQRDRQTCIIDEIPTNPESELEQALHYARLASRADTPGDTKQAGIFTSQVAKPIHGEVAYRLGRCLEDKAKDSAMPEDMKERYTHRMKELFEESARCEFESGIGRHFQGILESTTPLLEKTAKEHLNTLRRVSRNGTLPIQDMLAKAYFLGYTFGCGYVLKSDMQEAYEHANNNPSTLEMNIIRGVILSAGIEKPRKKGGKVAWELKPNENAARQAFEYALQLSEEVAYKRMYELHQSEHATADMKKFIFDYIQKKCIAPKPSLYAVRQLGVMYLAHGKANLGIKLLEKIAPVFNSPYGNFELSLAYAQAIGVQQDLKKATAHCIEGLLFYDKKTITTEGANPAHQCILKLASQLINVKWKEDQEVQKSIDELTQQLVLVGLAWKIDPPIEQAIDSSEKH